MSRVDNRSEAIGPKGVEFRTVGSSVAPVPTGRGIRREDYGKSGEVPIVDQGQGLIAGYTDDRSFAIPADGHIVFGDHTRAIKWVDFPFAVGADGTKVLRALDGLLPKFVFYALTGLEIPSRGYNRHWTVLRELVIPVPPIPVQREIVRTLDTFADLEAELQAELDARRRQYAHYRDSLLNFGDNPGVRWIPMGQFGTIFGGLTGKSKADFSDGNARYVSYRNVLNNLAVDVQSLDFVRIGPNERQRVLRQGDIIFTGSSETPDEVAMSSVVTADLVEPLYLNSFCIGYRPADPSALDPDFAKHLFRSRGMRSRLIRTASGVTRFNVSKARLAEVEIPIPPLADQRQFAELLNAFDTLLNDLSVGLPAELAARRQQYAYYRDRLMSFSEAA